MSKAKLNDPAPSHVLRSKRRSIDIRTSRSDFAPNEELQLQEILPDEEVPLDQYDQFSQEIDGYIADSQAVRNDRGDITGC